MEQTIERTSGISGNSAATNIFEQASRIGLRIDTHMGLLTVEDLWNLPLSSASGRGNLDDIAKGLRRELRSTEEESFVVAKKSRTDERLALAFEIAKHVIAVKLAEAEEARTQRERAEKKQKLLSIIARKQDEQLEGQSLEELTAAVNAL